MAENLISLIVNFCIARVCLVLLYKSWSRQLRDRHSLTRRTIAAYDASLDATSAHSVRHEPGLVLRQQGVGDAVDALCLSNRDMSCTCPYGCWKQPQEEL